MISGLGQGSTSVQELNEVDNSELNGVDKDMTFYLHYVNDSETSKSVIDVSTWYYFDSTLEWNDANATITVSATQQTLKWYLSPILASNFTVNSFDFTIWIRRIAGVTNPQTTIEIYEKDPNGETLVHSNNLGAIGGITGTPSEKTFSNSVGWGGYTFQAGNSIVMVVDINPGAFNTFEFIFDTASADSRVVFNSDDSLDITSVYLLDNEDTSRKNLDPTVINKTVRFRANLTDPLGGYDIKWVNLTLKSPSGSTILDNVSMTKVIGTPITFLNVYQREWNYSGFSSGTYDVKIWAVDNNGYNFYYYDGNANFDDYYAVKDWNCSIGDIAFLNVKVVDSKDIPLNGARVLILLNDTKIVEGVNMTNATGMANFTLFSAEYEILVYWTDTKVANITYDLVDNVTENGPLNITARVYYPNFRFNDPHQVALENASVSVIYPNGTSSTSPFRTNVTGEFNLTQVPEGNYRLIVRWRDVEVNNTVLKVENNTNYTISVRVYYMTVIARDDLGGVLPGAQIVIANNTTAIVFDSKVTNLTGSITSRLPAGPFDLTIYWRNTMVYESLNLTLNSDMTIDAFTGIFTLNITALDGHMVPVSKARILVTTTSENLLESNFTDDNGLVKSRLPRGTHIIKAYWRDVLVNETSFDIDDNRDIVLDLNINYPTIRVLDDAGVPLTNARVDLYFTGTQKLHGMILTDDVGETIHRVAATAYDIRVIWQDTLVNETIGVMLDSDEIIVVGASVYNLGVKVEDPHGMPVDGALVEMAFSDGDVVGVYTTDENGTLSVRLPGKSIDIHVYWFGVLVHERLGFQLDAKRDVTLVATIWYVNVTLVDSKGSHLESALVTLSFSDDNVRFGAISTESDGYAIFRVPSSTYDILVMWEKHIVFDGMDYELSADQDLELSCTVYHMAITIIDSRKEMVIGASVSVMYQRNGEVVTTGIIPDEGALNLRLPMDSYTVEAYWMGALIISTEPMNLTQDIELELNAWVYYLYLQLVDSREVPLTGTPVTVALSVTGMILGTGTTDDNGSVFLRLPGKIQLNISASWSGIQVLNVTGYELEADINELFHVDVFYIQFELLDTMGFPVENSQVVLRLAQNLEVMATGSSSTNGILEFRVCAGEYIVETVWWGIRIYKDTLKVTEDADISITTDVSYLTIIFKDSRDRVLVGAWVNLALESTGSTFGSGMTDDNGSIIMRLPHESYAITGYWMGVRVVLEPSIGLDRDTTEIVMVQVYYLDISVKDDRDQAVENGLISVIREEDNSFASVVPSGDSGSVTVRLPVGNYGIEVRWKDVVVAHDLEVVLDADEALTINARIFYLTFKAKDSEGAGLKDVRVRIEDGSGQGIDEGMTDKKGRTEFRLPVGTYTVRSRFVTTYMMSDVDITRSSELTLTSSIEHVERFSDHPPSIYTTNLFLAGFFSTILIVLLVLVIALGLRRRKAEAGSGVVSEIDEYPPPEAKEEEDGEEEEEDDGEEKEEGERALPSEAYHELVSKEKETEAPAEEIEQPIENKNLKTRTGPRDGSDSILDEIMKDVSSDEEPSDIEMDKKEVDE